MSASLSVLLVEDEPLIAMMLDDLLDSLGHTIVGTVDTVDSALAHVERGGFDLAILDVHLRGGEASWPVADALADRGVPFILASGGAADAPPPRHDATPRLAKPFTMTDVERVLDTMPR